MDAKSEIMQPDFIRQLAEALFNEQLATNWRFYLLIGGVTLLANIGWHMFAPYLKRRGETLATKADMAEILRQVSETTRVTEQVRSTVLQAEWVTREWRTVRRLKLEEILSAGYNLDHFVEQSIDKWINKKDVIVTEIPAERIQLLGSLYFPELKDEIVRVRVAYLTLQNLIIDSSQEIMLATNTNNHQAVEAAHEKFRDGYKRLYPEAHNSLLALEDKAAKQMAMFANA